MLREIDGSVRRRGYSGPLIVRDVQPTQTKDQEQTLACFLESLEPDYSQILEVLFEHYALEIHRLVRALLDNLECPGEKESRQIEINSIVRQVFVGAVSDFDQLRDAESIRVWLSKAAVNAVLAYRRRKRWQQVLTRPASSVTPQRETNRPQKIEQRYWAAVDGLTEKQRLCVVLRYVHNLSVPDIAHILEISDEKAHTHLTAARRTVQQRVSDSKGQPESGKVEKHPEIRRQIQASLDGLLDNVPSARMRLDQHLSTCAECQAFSREANQIASRLTEALQTRWPIPALNSADIQQLAAIAQVKLKKTRVANLFFIRFKEISLFGAVFLAILAALWGIRRVDTHESTPLFPPIPGPPPTPVEVSASVVKGASEQEEGLEGYTSEIIYNIEPSISANGRMAAWSYLPR